MTAYTETPANPAAYLPTVIPPPAAVPQVPGDFSEAVGKIVEYVQARGFIFEPWQIAAYITAVRTKPFVILAGISGTGKTKVPSLVADGTESGITIRPVRPDWTDSGEVLGYERIDGEFVVGDFLRAAKTAVEDTEKQYFFLFDEMNIARVEYYLAEIMTHIEERVRDENNRLRTKQLMPTAPAEWASVYLPDNLCLVGSVNMDETTHGFSRKVLDRSFVLEFSDIDLSAVGAVSSAATVNWPIENWRQRALSLSELPDSSDPLVLRAIATLADVNQCLSRAQLQVGYRVRDEIALFCVNARDCEDYFVQNTGVSVDALDLAIVMKVLPRIQGGTQTIRTVLECLLQWARGEGDAEAEPAFPRCAARVELMLSRLEDAGFTSYWL